MATQPANTDFGPSAALLWTLPPFRACLFRHLSPAQLSQALVWSRLSYAQVVKEKYAVIGMMRYRRYQPRFIDPRRSILFHAAPRVLDCTDYVPLLNDPELLSYYLTLFPNVTEVFDNSYRLTFRRSYFGFHDVQLKHLRPGCLVEGHAEDAETGWKRGVPGGIPLDWQVNIVEPGCQDARQ